VKPTPAQVWKPISKPVENNVPSLAGPVEKPAASKPVTIAQTTTIAAKQMTQSVCGSLQENLQFLGNNLTAASSSGGRRLPQFLHTTIWLQCIFLVWRNLLFKERHKLYQK